MGNDKQVKDILERTKSVFLPEIIKNPEGKPVLYSLEDEYAKTRKNTPFLLYLFVAGFIVLIIVISVIFISFIESRSRNIPIDIKDFEDLRLKELIDSSRKNETKVDQVSRELREMENDYQDVVAKINGDFSHQLDALALEDVSEADRSVKQTEIEANKNKQLNRAESEYNEKRKQKEYEISLLQKQSNSLTGSMADKAKQYKDIFGGEGKLQNLELRNLSKNYEQKLYEQKISSRKEKEDLILLYNPIFKEKNLLDLLQKTPSDSKKKDQYFSGISDDIAMEKAASKEQLAKLSDDMKNQLAITGRLRQIPYKNSVSRSVLHADSLAKQIFNSYDAILQKLVASVQGKNLSLKHYGYAFEYMTLSQQENGYILDPRDKANIGIYINKVHKARPGDVAYVFRTDDQYIATIRFKNNQGVLVGVQMDVVPNGEIRPMDKLMFKMESEQK